MNKRRQLQGVFLAIVLVGTLSVAGRSEARNLTNTIVKGYVALAPFYAGGSFCPCAFAQNLANALGTSTSETISLNVPIASVAPAFTYRFNPDLSVYERSANMLGPLFAERALTIGEGKFNFNVGYAHVDFDDINGTSLDHLVTRNGVFLTNTGDAAQLRTRLNLQTHVFAPTFRYGITDNVDVSFVLPILNTSLRLRNTTVAVANQTAPGQGDFSDFSTVANNIGNLRYVRTDPRVVGRTVGASASATGIGDIILRAKYNFWYHEQSAAAGELDLVLPTGKKRDLQGLDETHVIPRLIASHVINDRIEPHVSLGLDLNGDDVDRSSFIFDVGATLQIWRELITTVDFLGRSQFRGLRVNAQGLAGDGLLLNKSIAQCTSAEPCSGQISKVGIFPESFTQRTDVVDFAFGFRYSLGQIGSMYVGGVVPINDEGFRSDFIPTGGIEYTF